MNVCVFLGITNHKPPWDYQFYEPLCGLCWYRSWLRRYLSVSRVYFWSGGTLGKGKDLFKEHSYVFHNDGAPGKEKSDIKELPFSTWGTSQQWHAWRIEGELFKELLRHDAEVIAWTGGPFHGSEVVHSGWVLISFSWTTNQLDLSYILIHELFMPILI